jgi:bifunctional non-homologous end joining protein LigD
MRGCTEVDGYRLVTTVASQVRIWSRNAIEWTDKVPELRDHRAPRPRQRRAGWRADRGHRHAGRFRFAAGDAVGERQAR